MDPIFTDNTFPEGTDLFCQLPLPTLIYQPQAAPLGDMIWLCVQTDVKINLSLGFSRAFKNALDIPRSVALYLPLEHISWQSDYMVLGH